MTPLLGFRTGIGRSVAELVGALDSRDDVRLLPFALGLRSPLLRGQAPPGTRFAPVSTRLLLAAWSRGDHPRLGPLAGRGDLMHATNFVAPPRKDGHRVLVTVNDAWFLHAPDEVTPVVRSFLRVLRRAIDRGAFIHVTTDAVGREVDELLAPGLAAAGRIIVVPWALPSLAPASADIAPQQRCEGGDISIVAIGTIDTRKNLGRLVDAFGLLAPGRPRLRLVLAGAPGSGSAEVAAAIDRLPAVLAARADVLGAVDEETRARLLHGAAVIAYPSRYEGFGFPLLEAMAAGVPVVTGNAAPLVEVAGGAAVIVEPTDVHAIAAGLASVLDDEPCAARMRALGRARVGAFTWQATADALVAAYRRVASSS